MLLDYQSITASKVITQNDNTEIIKMNITQYICDKVGGTLITNVILTDMKGAYLNIATIDSELKHS